MKRLSYKEKLEILNGKDMWHTKDIKNIKSIIMSDGPHGLCRQIGGQFPNEEYTNIKATTFPVAAMMASTFNPDLIYQVGKAIAKEAKSVNVSLLLGPGVNIKRNVLCGRNFEYYSEDPYVAGKMGSSFVNGVQSENVGACVKHFLANNQEYKRLVVNSIIDERALNEIYLKPFKIVIDESNPRALMTSYNMVNNYHTSESPMVKDIIRNKFKYDGLVISDWGGVNDSIQSINAGLNLEMPYCPSRMDYLLNNINLINEEEVNNSIEKLQEFYDKSIKIIDDKNDVNNINEKLLKDNYKISKKVSDEGIILLKNENILPLKSKNILLIGEFAKKIRIQGGGSSHMNPYIIKNPIECFSKYYNVDYAKGYDFNSDKINDDLVLDAINKAKKNDTIIIFTGLDEIKESEGYDRQTINLNENQIDLVNKISKYNENIIVVNVSGSVVSMPFVDNIKGLIQMYFAGEAGAESLADIIYGNINPSGKLAETFIKKIEDSSVFLNGFSLKKDEVYHESIFVGYRYYDLMKTDVLYPFGYGLSYSDFLYSDLKINNSIFNENEEIYISFDVYNNSIYDGLETCQLYISNKSKLEIFPKLELKKFNKIFIKSYETKKVEFVLTADDFKSYNIKFHDFYLSNDDYIINIGNSSKNILLQTKIKFKNILLPPLKFDLDTTLNELLSYEKTKDIALNFLNKYNFPNPDNKIILPLRNYLYFDYKVKKEDILLLLDECNTAIKN